MEKKKDFSKMLENKECKVIDFRKYLGSRYLYTTWLYE